MDLEGRMRHGAWAWRWLVAVGGGGGAHVLLPLPAGPNPPPRAPPLEASGLVGLSHHKLAALEIRRQHGLALLP